MGGRIYTKSIGTHLFELSATWVFQDQLLKQLIEELGLEFYPPYLHGDALIKYDPSMTIHFISSLISMVICSMQGQRFHHRCQAIGKESLVLHIEQLNYC